MPATSATTATTEVLTGFNIAFDTSGQKWITRYSYIPEGFEYLKNKFFSFSGGQIYRHGASGATNNRFYGVSGVSMIKVVSNFNPSLVKAFDAISLEGNDSWAATANTTDQTTTIATGDFQEKERSYYADIPRDTATTLTTNTSNITTLGVPASDSGNVITFSNRINRQPIPIGTTAGSTTPAARVYKVASTGVASNPASAAAYASAVSSNTLSLMNATGGAIDASTDTTDVIIIQTESKIDGDQLRDHYLVVELQNDNFSKDVELYAVNIKYKRSRLDDSLGNQAEIQ